MQYIADNTTIPIPKLHCCFEDDDAVYLIMEYIEGVTMNDLSEEQRCIVQEELAGHLATLHSLRSKTIGGPSGLVLPPYRVTLQSPRDAWMLRASESEEYVFCHNDLSQQNIIVDPQSLKILAIIDWNTLASIPNFSSAHFTSAWVLPLHLMEK